MNRARRRGHGRLISWAALSNSCCIQSRTVGCSSPGVAKQASKSTPTGAIAQFAAGGKPVKKKDLGMMAMSYGYVYVAQVAMGADMNQCIRAFKEAEAYEGPSLIIAYAPCISHGIKKGMAEGMNEEKLAIEKQQKDLLNEKYNLNKRIPSDGVFENKDKVKSNSLFGSH